MTSPADLKQFKETLDTTEDTKEVLEILGKLQKASVTLELLKSTQIGLAVGNLRKRFGDNKKIVDESKKIVADWKASCVVGGNGTPDKTSNVKTPTKKAEEKKETPKESTPTNDKKRKLNSSDEVRKKPTPSPSSLSSSGGIDGDRDRARVMLAEALGEAQEGHVWDPSDAATTIEGELYSIFKGATKDYKAKLRSLIFNLKKNENLRKDILTGDLTVEKFCSMSAAEMASEEEQKKRRDTEKWHLEAATIGKMEASTDQFLCGKCKNRKCTYYQLQTRSADEPMTTFVTCTVCNNRWKFC